MVSSFQRAVRMSTDPYQANHAGNVGHSEKQTDRHIASDTESLYDRRSPESKRWIGARDAKLDQREEPHPRKLQRVTKPVSEGTRVAGVGLKILRYKSFFPFGKPTSTIGLVCAQLESEQAHEYRGNALKQKYPLPIRQACASPKRTHDPAGKRPAENTSNRYRCHEQSNHLRTSPGRKPIDQVKDRSRHQA